MENGEPIGASTDRFVTYMDEDAPRLGVSACRTSSRARRSYVAADAAMIGKLESNGLAYSRATAT